MFAKICVLFFAILFASACSLKAQIVNIVNGGFETDPNNFASTWQVDPEGTIPEIVSSFSTAEHGSSTADIVLSPFEGRYFIVLKSDNGGADPNYGQVMQTITVNANDSITGAYFFSTSDWVDPPPPWNDTAYINLVPADSNKAEITLAYEDVFDVGSFGSMTGWASFRHTFASNEAGTYTLVLRIKDFQDNKYTSYFAVDALNITDGPLPPVCDYVIAGDINGDCKVDFLDFAGMAANWLIDCNAEPVDPACTAL